MAAAGGPAMTLPLPGHPHSHSKLASRRQAGEFAVSGQRCGRPDASQLSAVVLAMLAVQQMQC